MRCLLCGLLALCLVAASSPVHADFINPGQATPGGATPFTWVRDANDTTSTYVHWDVFDVYPAADTTPDISGSAGFTNSGSVQELVGDGFLTSGGNIYSPTTASQFDVNFGGAGLVGPSTTTRIIAQFRTQGSELDRSSVLLQLNGNSVAPVFSEELSRVALGGFGGVRVDWLATWDLVGSAANYQLKFQAASSSMSLDQLAIDTHSAAAVPEPASIALLGTSGLTFAAYRRRKSKQLKTQL